MATSTTTARTTSPTPKPKKVSRPEGGRLAAAMLSPTMIVILLVVGYPIVAAIRESLYRQQSGLDESGFVRQGSEFVGLQNYTDALTGDASEVFWNAFSNTTFFTVTTVTLEVVIGVLMALIMNKAFTGRGLVRASILVPWAVPTAISALLWRWIFNADGVANAMLGKEILWSSEGWQAKLAVIIADTWKTAPFIGLLVLAGLQIIPAEVYEAARVDGASAMRQFWSITLPLVKPALLVAVLFRLLDVLRMFDLPFLLVGQDKRTAQTLSIIAFKESNNTNFGPAAAYATLLFLYVVVVAFVFVKVLGADVIGDKRDAHGAPAKKKSLRKTAIARGESAA